MDKQALLNALLISEQNYGLIETLHLFCGNDFRVSIPFSQSMCNTQISELQLSVRSYNALMRAGLLTIDQVIDAISNQELLKIRNLGMKSYREIKTRVLLFGFEALTDSGKRRFFNQLIELNPKIHQRIIPVL